MKEITFIGIFDENGKPFYSYERVKQGKLENSDNLFLNFIQSLQMFARSLGQDELKTITMNNYKIFGLKDNNTKFVFFLKCALTLKPKKVSHCLKEMRNLFINNYLENINLSVDKKAEIA